MQTYDNRPITLDPGLTALALRGLHERDGHYPFLDRFVRRSPRGAASARAAVAPPRAASRPGRWLGALQWYVLRHRAASSV